MIGRRRPVFNTIREFHEARLRHKPGAEDLMEDGKYVRTYITVAQDVADVLRHVYDTTETGKTYAVAQVACHAIEITALSMVAAAQNVRTYLLNQQKLATELPVHPREGTEYLERNANIGLKLLPEVWSLAKVMEEEMDTPVDSALRYGISVMRLVQRYDDHTLSLVDYQGRTGSITTYFPSNIDLSGPPESV